MSVQIFTLAGGEKKTIEKVILDKNLNFLHMILPMGEGLPDHRTNAPVYMTVVRGTLSIGFEDDAPRDYPAGTVLKIAYDTRMLVKNTREEPLELIVVKAPPPAM